MTKLFTITATLLVIKGIIFPHWIVAQAPEKISYQAVIRNSNNQLIVSKKIGMQISIMQGSSSGTAIYVETHAPTTNANGLITIIIGDGTVVSGTFSIINWSNGPYFIKTETDPAGGTNYTITGTSQLLSVPYALHSKTAERISGNITETDPVFGLSVAKNIRTSDTTRWGNSIHAETDPAFGMSVAKHITTADTTRWGASVHKIGESYGGGIVFYVYDGGQHGLIAATTDQGAGVHWNNNDNYVFSVTNAVRDGIGAGKFNTERIIMSQGSGDYAAQRCANYQGGKYGDWYLPSKYELYLLYLQKDVVGGLSNSTYWSSTEVDIRSAWYQTIDSNFPDYFYPKSVAFNVRAIRAF